MADAPAIVWIKNALRLRDNPALTAAAGRGAPVIPAYIRIPDSDGRWAAGELSRWWLHRSLLALDEDLRRLHSRLFVLHGDPAETLVALAGRTGAKTVFWTRGYEPETLETERRLREELPAHGLEPAECNATLLHEPWEVRTRAGGPYQVFTPFWKSCQQQSAPPCPLPIPARLPAPPHGIDPLPPEAWRIDPGLAGAKEMEETWRPGEEGAQACLEGFLASGLRRYEPDRDAPAKDSTSRLSAHLHFGEISPRTAWHAVTDAMANGNASLKKSGGAFLRQLGWREFAHHLLYHFPMTPAEPLKRPFARFPWRKDSELLNLWQRGETGYPFVDAGLRQLSRTGWMHNRVRMAAASFLVKDLLQPWQDGSRWFWQTLVDADLANNTLGWQWVAGCGADAAPYFRIFNPVSQGKRFDPSGAYIRCWLPELERMPDRWIHAPWTAPAWALDEAGVRLGENYPRPLVDHAEARKRALAAYEKIRGGDTPRERDEGFSFR